MKNAWDWADTPRTQINPTPNTVPMSTQVPQVTAQPVPQNTRGAPGPLTSAVTGYALGKATNYADKELVNPAVDGIKSIWKDMTTAPTAVSSPVQGGTAGVIETSLAPLADTPAAVAAPETAATIAAPLSSAATGGLTAGESAVLASEVGSTASMAAGAGAGGAAATSAAVAETGLAATPFGWPALAAAAVLSNDDWRKKISDGMARLDPTQIGKGK